MATNEPVESAEHKSPDRSGVLRLQIVSDLHLEQLDRSKPEWKHLLVRPVCDIIAVLGDTCELQHEEMWVDFTRYLSSNWKTVILVNGNHEYHCSDFVKSQPRTDGHTMEEDDDIRRGGIQAKTIKSLKARQKYLIKQHFSNVHLLDNSDLIMNAPDGRRIRIVGTTLWSYIPYVNYAKVQRDIRDYSRVFVESDVGGDPVLATPQDTTLLHQDAVRYLYDAIVDHSHENTEVVVLTHHAPLKTNTSDPQYERDRDRACNAAFSSEQSSLMKPNVRLWAFGHTHWHADFMFRDTRIYSNPRGYGDHDPALRTYRPDMILEI